MSSCQITLSANAGAALHLGSVRLWADALHDKTVSGFSTLTPELQAAVAAHPDFADPNLIFLHPLPPRPLFSSPDAAGADALALCRSDSAGAAV